MQAAAETRQTRRWKRVPVELPALLVTDDGIGHQGTVIDLSSGGARVEMKGDHHVGSHLVLRLHGFRGGPLSLSADVVHSEGMEAGLKFRSTEDLARLKLLLSPLKA